MSVAKVVLVRGPYGGGRGELSATPPRILVGGIPYVRVDDPDTGAFLGGYVWEPAVIEGSRG